jgi:hypothetical protein
LLQSDFRVMIHSVASPPGCRRRRITLELSKDRKLISLLSNYLPLTFLSQNSQRCQLRGECFSKYQHKTKPKW